MQLNRQTFTPQTLSKYLASVDTACTSRCKDRDSVIILHLGVLGDKDRGEPIMYSTSTSPALASFRLTTEHFLIFTRYFLVDRVFSLSALSVICVSVVKLSGVTSRSPPPGLLRQPLPCSGMHSFVVDESSLQALCQDLQ